MLDDVATGLRAFGDLVEAEYGRVRAGRAEEALQTTLDVVRETRAVLTELTLIEVDPRERNELWLLHGSVLAAIEHVLVQIDVEHTERSMDSWVNRHALPVLRRPLIPPRRRREL